MRLPIAAAVAALVVSAVTGVAAPAPAASPTPGTGVGSPTVQAGRQPTTAAGDLMLPTGERVRFSTVQDQAQVRLTSPSGGDAKAASVISANGHTYVVPAEAAPFIGRGLALSAFDVSASAASEAAHPAVPVTLAARFGPSYRSLPPGLIRLSRTTVRVADPAAFGAALARASRAAQASGARPSLLDGVSLSGFGATSGVDGVVTRPAKGRLFTVKVIGLDRNGDRDVGDLGVLMNADDTGRFIAGQSFYRGTFSFSVPRGHYSVQSFIVTPDEGSYTLAVNPEFLVDKDTTVTLDARDGKRVSIHAPRPTTPVHAELNLQRNPRNGLSFTDSLTTFDDTPLYATPTDPVTVGRLFFYPAARLGDANGSVDHYLYDLEFPSKGAVPTDLRYDVTADSVATVHAEYASVVPGRDEQESRIGGLPWQASLVGAINDIAAPLRRTEYVSAQHGLRWHQEVDLDPAGGNGRTIARTAIYRPGQQVASRWHTQPMGSGPEQETNAGQPCPICRTDDTLLVGLFPHVDSNGDFMLPDAATTESLTLYQDGTNVGSSRGGFASFTLSPDPASYQLVYDADTEASWWPSSTHVSTAWSFDSAERAPDQLPPGWTCGGKAAVDDGCSFEQILLPRYATPAGLDGVIPAGTTAHVTVHVTPQRGLAPDPLASLTGEVSYDGGATWASVTAIARSDTTYRLRYRQPDLAETDGFASLRISAVGASGAGVDQMVLHAYPLAPLETRPAPGGPLGCAAPVAPPLTGCQAVLGTVAGGSPADPPVGYGPADLRTAYHLPAHRTSEATVAIVTPYDDPNAAADLAVYRKEFGLPKCTAASGCFTKVNQDGNTSPLPPSQSDWALQTSQALDAVSAVCPTCNLLVVEADSTSLADLAPAAVAAKQLGADVISNGYGTEGEFSGEQIYERSYRSLDVPFVVASADYGYGNGAPLVGSISYPSASRYAVAVGATTLTPAQNDRGFTETAWSSTTSGCSAYIGKPTWQHDRLCAKRTTADVAAVGDPATALAVYDTFGFGGWLTVGGTSLATAVIAGVYGLKGSATANAAAALYADGAALFDITDGVNGECKATYLCTAAVGYDGPSGAGTPNGISAFGG